MLDIVRQHPRAVFYAVIVHIGLIGILVFSFRWSDKPATMESKGKGEEIIRAVTVDASKIEKELKKIKAAETKKQRELERAVKKAKDARLKEERSLAEAKKKNLAEQREQENRRMQEQVRIKELEEKRQQEEKKIQELEQQEEDRRQKLEQQKREEELRKKLAEEQQRLNLEGDKQRLSMVNQYRAMIEAKVRQNWIVPASAQEGMSCVLQVRLIPSGDVTHVQLVKSSGDEVFDRSVENAIRKASPLPVPSADSGLFDVFRDLKFPFTLEKKN